MVSEKGDVQTFLAQHPPFNHLSEKQLEYASGNIFVAFSKSGSELQLNNSAEDRYAVGMFIVRSGSMEIRTEQNVLLDRLSAGDYLVPGVLSRETENSPRIIVLEDCLYYELTDSAFQTLCAGSSEMAALRDENKTPLIQVQSQPESAESVSQQHVVQLTKDAYLTQHVKDTMSPGVIFADLKITIREAAQLMKQHRVSSLLIKDGKGLVGIITDRDFRTRVLADGVADSDIIEHVMTAAPMCIDVNSRLHDAQLLMMSEGVHHLPVVEDDNPVGIITPSDILRANNIEPLSLVRSINRASDIEQLSDAADGIPALVVRLIEHDARAVEVGKIITTLTDGITKRLLTLAEEKFGTPPCDYAWLAFGSQARQEQVLGSDQDNGLLLPDGISIEDANYFKEFTAFVNDGLDACGMPYCPGDIMAKNEKWRMSLKDWKICFAGWIEEPSPKAVMHSSIFFDMRHIAGKRALTKKLRAYVLKRAKKNTIFLAMMCENALLHSPPLGFFKTFVLESDGDHNNALDLKKRGTIPIVDIARQYTLSAGLKPLNTIERLQAIEKAGEMSKEMACSLIDAHEFIAGIRLEAQGKQYRAGEKADNYLDPKELSPLVRHQLKDAFHVVRDAQSAMKVKVGGGVL
jgi:CBS domain-containing protein